MMDWSKTKEEKLNYLDNNYSLDSQQVLYRSANLSEDNILPVSVNLDTGLQALADKKTNLDTEISKLTQNLDTLQNTYTQKYKEYQQANATYLEDKK